MPRRHLSGLSSKSLGARRRKHRYQGPPLPELPVPPVWDGTVEDTCPPRCPAAPDECKCAAERAGQEGG